MTRQQTVKAFQQRGHGGIPFSEQKLAGIVDVTKTTAINTQCPVPSSLKNSHTGQKFVTVHRD
jgi:hypothetical protein